MRWPLLLVLIFILLLMQTTLVRWMDVAGARPDLLLILVLFVSLNARPDDSFLTSVLVGLCKDVYSAQRFGLYTLLFAAVGVAVNLVRKDLFKEHFFTQMLVAVACAGACNVVVSLVHMLTYGLWNGWHFLALSVAGAAYTAVVTPIGFAVLARLRRYMGPRREPVFHNV